MYQTVNQTARRLGLSTRQVRRYAEQGVIETTRFGRDIVISDVEVDRMKVMTGLRGRAWSQDTVSAVLRELDGMKVVYRDKFEKNRVLTTLRKSESVTLLRQCARHAITERYALPKLEREEIAASLLLTGVSSHLLDSRLVGNSTVLEGYAIASNVMDFVQEWDLVRDLDGQLVLHRNLPVLDNTGRVAKSQQIVDLFRSGDSRERAVAIGMMSAQIEQWRIRDAH